MFLLENTIQPYAWGRTDGVAALVGSAPTGAPEAELWVGAHPAAPSRVVDDPAGRTLAEVIASDPARWLGADLLGRGISELPFLLKVLAIGEPLSLQAHPSAAQARNGFAREEAAGIALDAPDRTYRDASAKPEALVSLGETWALCGFRRPGDAAELVGRLGVAALDPLAKVLRHTDDASAMADAFSWVLHVGTEERAALTGSIARAARDLASGEPADPYRWVARLADLHPDDPTSVAPLLLNVVHLAPDDAVHLPAGNLHAYLAGAGVEVMAASDNVLRGGLTTKHVDVDELLAIVRFDAGVPRPPARRRVAPGVTVFDAGEATFGLAVVDAGPTPVQIAPTGPSLLLATGGEVVVSGPVGGATLRGGTAAFVAPREGALAVSGRGRLWWATVGDALPG